LAPETIDPAIRLDVSLTLSISDLRIFRTDMTTWTSRGRFPSARRRLAPAIAALLGGSQVQTNRCARIAPMLDRFGGHSV
jgi:hypothetical protein